MISLAADAHKLYALQVQQTQDALEQHKQASRLELEALRQVGAAMPRALQHSRHPACSERTHPHQPCT
jgi:hypothetical protein